MKQITVVFFGRSGSGKGTQADLLIKYLEQKYSEHKVLYVETGARFREFQKADNYTAAKVKEVTVAGKFLPPFFPIWNWTGFLVENFTGDGTFDFRRRLSSAGGGSDSRFRFAILRIARSLHCFASRSSQRRSQKTSFQTRTDTTIRMRKIDERMHAFESGAMPSIRVFQKSLNVTFVIINGDQTIPEVFEDIEKSSRYIKRWRYLSKPRKK